MPAPEAQVRVGPCDVLVLGTIPGFVPEAARVSDAFARFRPDRLALGVPDEDLAGLEALASDPEAYKEMVPPDDATGRRLELLKRFGEIRIPSPDLQEAFRLGKAHGIPIDAIDLDDHAYAQQYTQRVKFWHVLQSNARAKKVLKIDFPGARDAYELELAWDRGINGREPYAGLEAEREKTMARRLRETASGCQRLLAIVPAARHAGVVRSLGTPQK
jgi:hypothetical protein